MPPWAPTALPVCSPVMCGDGMGPNLGMEPALEPTMGMAKALRDVPVTAGLRRGREGCDTGVLLPITPQ